MMKRYRIFSAEEYKKQGLTSDWNERGMSYLHDAVLPVDYIAGEDYFFHEPNCTLVRGYWLITPDMVREVSMEIEETTIEFTL